MYRAFIWFYTTPFKAIKNVLFGTFYKPCLVGIFYSYNKPTAVLAGKKIIEQRGARAADVQEAGGGGGETGDDGAAGFGLACAHADNVQC